MKKTVKQLNQEAGEFAAIVWLQSADKILFHGNSPMKLSSYSRECFAINLIPEWFRDDAAKSRPCWGCSARNWRQIRQAALAHAQRSLLFGNYPKVAQHFRKEAA
jgi:hypothetical protein